VLSLLSLLSLELAARSEKGRLSGVTFVCERGSRQVQQRGDRSHSGWDDDSALKKVILARTLRSRITSLSARRELTLE